jgi:glycosyltransferase involved in cell wall biosynthesis
MGQKKCIRKILSLATMLFPNSYLETKKIEERYGFNAHCITIPNGVDPELFSFDEQSEKDECMVLCVARIEGIKNQINLIKALNNTRYSLLIIGSPAPNQQSYYRECRRIAASNIRFMDQVDQSLLPLYYQRAKVHALPSWFEACGLSSLEASVMGCNIVITDRGYTREYYGKYAFYCDPGSPDSILRAVNNAAKADIPKVLREKVLYNYTWMQTAKRIEKAYQFIMHEHPLRLTPFQPSALLPRWQDPASFQTHSSFHQKKPGD